MELRKCGLKGFNKASDDLIIKTSKDIFVPNSFDWSTKANRKRALELNFLDCQFMKVKNCGQNLMLIKEMLLLLHSKITYSVVFLPERQHMVAR